MPTTPLVQSRSGVQVPALLYGTAWKKEQTAALVSQAIRAGFRGIDTACQPKHYHEAGVGDGVAACLSDGLKRTDLYLQTKFTSLSGQDPQRVPYDPRASLPEQVQQSFAASLRHLQTTYLDSLVLHSPMQTLAQTLQVWRAMESLVEQGIVRQLGISNCYELSVLQRIDAAARIKPAVLQNRFYADTGYDREIRAYCRERGVLYQSFWTLSANPQLLASETLQSLAKHYASTPAQILFRYLTHEGVVPLTGTKSTAHLRDDLAIFGFELTASERDAITRLLE
ncbi:aldo/keto reductase [Povalibacter sp.]|uniref:aldo/keto reductase family protein n=1 Tax=Povalibacter sp. TaxID=1962978 RepID=UPI002F4094E6